jgi:hypothetical protein
MKFYHGTSDAFGIDTGDRMDPSHGGFEAAVYATSDLSIARRWARARCAVAGGEPVVFEVEIADGANVRTVAGCDPAEYETIASDGADALVDTAGEGGAVDLVVLSRFGASFGAVVA